MLLAVAPLFLLVLRQFGGVRRVIVSIPVDRLHAWQGIPFFAPHAAMDRFGLIFGLGLACCVGHQILALTHVLRYGSQMAANFYGAVVGFVVALATTLLIGWLHRPNASSAVPGQRTSKQPQLVGWPALT